MSYHVNEKGYYGQFGGAFIPEMLYPNVEELRQNYLKIMAEPRQLKRKKFRYSSLLQAKCWVNDITRTHFRRRSFRRSIHCIH